MKPIKIAQKNAAAIHAALEAVNGRATSFTITLWSEVMAAAEDAERKLAALPKTQRKGASAVYIPAGPSASAYKYGAKSTRLNMVRRPTGWFLTGVSETTVYPRQAQWLRIAISREQADEVARRAVADFLVEI